MIEAKMLERGISREELEFFATLENYDGKREILNAILTKNPSLNERFDGKFLRFLEILKDILIGEGVRNRELFIPEYRGVSLRHIIECWKKFEKENFREAMGYLMISRMEETLSWHSPYDLHEIVSLDRLYQDTVERLKKEAEEAIER